MSRRPTTWPGGTGAPGLPSARTAPATGHSTVRSTRSPSPAATSTWAATSSPSREIPAINGIAQWNGSAWSALGSNGSGGAALGSGSARALLVSGTDLLVGGAFANAGGIAQADCVATWGIVPAPPPVVRKPDGRVNVGTGAYVGNNVYNTTGASQNRTGSALRGQSVSFHISIQNDGTSADRFKVKATGTATTRYTVAYYHGATNITTKVVAGTYLTPSLAVGAAYLITAKVTVKSTATVGSSVTRLVTITSAASSTKKDAVKVIGKRK